MSIPNNIRPLWVALQQEVIETHYRWNILRALFGTASKRDVLQHSAPGFFSVVHDAVLNDLEAALAKFGDPPDTCGRSNASLEKLIDEVKKGQEYHVERFPSRLEAGLDKYQRSCEAIKVSSE